MTYKNRIVGHGEEDPGQLAANPRNWRIHPHRQEEALAGVLNEIGWVDTVLVNQRTGFVVDGHLRVAHAIGNDEPSIPVTYVDLSEEEEAIVLASFDPISAMAATDSEALRDLLASVETDNESLRAILESLNPAVVSPDDPMEHWQGMPLFEQEDQLGVFRLVVNFASEDYIPSFEALIGQPVPRTTAKAASVWYPPVARAKASDGGYEAEADDAA